jgi:hypothetical protein
MADEAATASVVQPLDIFPWHEPARLRMEVASSGARLPHAVLVHGPGGVGKERLPDAATDTCGESSWRPPGITGMCR